MAEQVRRAVNEAVFVSAANVVGSIPTGWAISGMEWATLIKTFGLLVPVRRDKGMQWFICACFNNMMGEPRLINI